MDNREFFVAIFQWFAGGGRVLGEQICCFMDYPTLVRFRNMAHGVDNMVAVKVIDKLVQKSKRQVKEWKDFESGTVSTIRQDTLGVYMDKDITDVDKADQERLCGPMAYTRMTSSLCYDCNGGYVPKNLHSFVNVQHLSLQAYLCSGNNIPVTIPTDLYWTDNLKALEIGGLDFDAFPKWSAVLHRKFCRLQYVRIMHNPSIKQLPRWLCMQPGLRSLWIGQCPKLTTFPEDILRHMNDVRAVRRVWRKVKEYVRDSDIMSEEEKGIVEVCLDEGRIADIDEEVMRSVRDHYMGARFLEDVETLIFVHDCPMLRADLEVKVCRYPHVRLVLRLLELLSGRDYVPAV